MKLLTYLYITCLFLLSSTMLYAVVDSMPYNVPEFRQGRQITGEERLLKEIQETNKKSSEPSIGTYILIVCNIALATFALCQIFISRSTARNQLRAYLGVRPYGSEKRDDDIAAFSITNFGQTPAYNVQSYLITGVHEYPLKSKLSTSPMNKNRSILNPGWFNVLHSNHYISPESIEAMTLGTEACYFWGEVHYTDIYKKLRTVKFTFVGRYANGEFVIENHEEGNESN